MFVNNSRFSILVRLLYARFKSRRRVSFSSFSIFSMMLQLKLRVVNFFSFSKCSIYYKVSKQIISISSHEQDSDVKCMGFKNFSKYIFTLIFFPASLERVRFSVIITSRRSCFAIFFTKSSVM